MLPARLVLVESMPRTASGKIDRAALPLPGCKRPMLAHPYVAPETELEKQLAAIWAEVLGLEQVGRHDPFPELGGDSLLAVQLEARIRQELPDGLPVRRLLSVSTVAQMAQLIRYQVVFALPMPPSRAPDRLRRLHHLFRRGLDYLTDEGPRLGDKVLPYAQGLRLQRLWLALPGVQQVLLHRHVWVFKGWLQRIGRTDRLEEQLAQHLMVNTWFVWRERALRQSEEFAFRIALRGFERVQQAARAGRGAVLVIPHNHVLFPFIRQRLAEQVFRESYFLGGSDLPNEVSAKTAEMAARVRRSQKVLNRGGAVWIAGDGDFGTVRYSLPFYGRQLPFRAGTAVLAVRAGAPLIAVFPSMDRQGGLSIEFAAPLAPLPQDSLNLQIHDLLQQYAELYIDRWPQMLPHLSANLLWDRFVNLPRMEIAGS